MTPEKGFNTRECSQNPRGRVPATDESSLIWVLIASPACHGYRKANPCDETVSFPARAIWLPGFRSTQVQSLALSQVASLHAGRLHPAFCSKSAMLSARPVDKRFEFTRSYVVTRGEWIKRKCDEWNGFVPLPPRDDTDDGGDCFLRLVHPSIVREDSGCTPQNEMPGGEPQAIDWLVRCCHQTHVRCRLTSSSTRYDTPWRTNQVTALARNVDTIISRTCTRAVGFQ